MIGYYVHHHGSGHLTRAHAVAAALADDVVGLSTLPAPDGDAFAAWVQLPPDDADPAPRDVTAHATLHWAPVAAPRAGERIAALTGWVARERPGAVVVDVSVEAALAVRLAAAPVVVVAQPGRRDDPPHRMAYGLADAVVAPWAREVYDPAWLRPFAPRVSYVGAVSRFDGRMTGPPPADGPVLRLGGTGGGWVSGGPGTEPGPDVWAALQSASVVVCHAGLNVLAEVAAARRPAVVVAQDRPFDEQHETARALVRAGLAVDGASGRAWPELLHDARQLDPTRWRDWSFGDGAARAAAVIDAVVAGVARGADR